MRHDNIFFAVFIVIMSGILIVLAFGCSRQIYRQDIGNERTV